MSTALGREALSLQRLSPSRNIAPRCTATSSKLHRSPNGKDSGCSALPQTAAMRCEGHLRPDGRALDRPRELAKLDEVGVDLRDRVLEVRGRQVLVMPRGGAAGAVAGQHLALLVGHPALGQPG